MLTVTACQGGAGVVYTHATNTSTGQSETHSALLVETPSGSGTYIAQIPPLAPLHGLGTLDPQITCPGTTNVLPDGGALGGGTSAFFRAAGSPVQRPWRSARRRPARSTWKRMV